VGVRVVAVVVTGPPADTDPDRQVPEKNPQQVVTVAAAGDLAMPGIVTEEGQLCEDRGQERRGCELPPRFADQDESGPSGDQREQNGRGLPDVVPRPAVQQPGVAYLPQQPGIVAAPGGAGASRFVDPVGGNSVFGGFCRHVV